MSGFQPPYRAEPIKPENVAAFKLRHIPNEVIDAVNELISLKYVCNSDDIRIYQKDIIEVAKSKMYPATDNIDSGSGYFDYNWLNIEKIYEDAGWAVKYDKPAYNESYDAYFIFREKKG